MSEEMSAFGRYVAAFEEAYDADDWNLVGDLFHDEIVWNVFGLPEFVEYRAVGRENTCAAVQRSCQLIDRRFDQRIPEPASPPVAIPGGIHLDWIVTYTREGLPPLILRGEEWDVFRDGKLIMHFELIRNGAETAEYFTAHEAALIPM